MSDQSPSDQPSNESPAEPTGSPSMPPPLPPMGAAPGPGGHGAAPPQGPWVQPHGGGYPMAVSPNDRQMAMFAHLAQFAAFVFPFGNILAPLIIMVTKGTESPFVRAAAVESLNFAISTTLLFFVFFILSFLLIGIPFLLLLMLAAFVMPIIGAIKANDGENYRYPLNIRMVS